MLTTTDLGNVTQGYGAPDHQVLLITGAQHFQVWARVGSHGLMCGRLFWRHGVLPEEPNAPCALCPRGTAPPEHHAPGAQVPPEQYPLNTVPVFKPRASCPGGVGRVGKGVYGGGALPSHCPDHPSPECLDVGAPNKGQRASEGWVHGTPTHTPHHRPYASVSVGSLKTRGGQWRSH